MSITEATSIAALMAEVNPVSQYFLQKINTSFDFCDSHTKLHFNGFKCLPSKELGKQNVTLYKNCYDKFQILQCVV